MLNTLHLQCNLTLYVFSSRSSFSFSRSVATNDDEWMWVRLIVTGDNEWRRMRMTWMVMMVVMSDLMVSNYVWWVIKDADVFVVLGVASGVLVLASFIVIVVVMMFSYASVHCYRYRVRCFLSIQASSNFIFFNRISCSLGHGKALLVQRYVLWCSPGLWSTTYPSFLGPSQGMNSKEW